MSGQPLDREHLYRLLEAARWAPSSGNSQPWRFVYALNQTPEFATFFDLLLPGNRPWCAKAGALLVVASQMESAPGKPLVSHSFDAGASWMSLALQGSRLGLVTHGIVGFDYEQAAHAIRLPPSHHVECMIAVGYPGRLEDLDEKYRPREVQNDRMALAEFSFEGAFPAFK